MFLPKTLKAIALASLFGASASAFDIQLDASPGLSANPAALSAFERAAAAWEARIADPITIVIKADLEPLGPAIIGSTSSIYLSGDNFAEIRDAMAADDLAEGGTLGQFLPTFAQLNVVLPAGRTVFNSMSATQANLKALGFPSSLLEIISGHREDATISFSTNFNFDFDSSDGVGVGLVDFQTAATHELAHALGFVSAVDNIDYTTVAEYSRIYLNPLDLFRFGNVPGADPATPADFTTFARDLRPGFAAHFDDLINEFEMATGFNGGDGRQASHWKDDQLTGTIVIDENGYHYEPGILIGIMDPTLDFGVSYGPSEADFALLDAIGYQILPAIPEPSAALLALLGGATFLRRRRG